MNIDHLHLGDGEHALVTGASRGLGRALVHALADRGLDVVAGVRDPSSARELESLATKSRGSVRVARVDLTDLADVELPAGLRILVNNAAVRREYLAVEQMSSAEWRSILEANVVGPLELIRKALPIMRAGGAGVICNVTTSAMLTPKPFFGAYSGSKATLSTVTDILRLEVAMLGIRVVEILPGPLDTEMLATSLVHHAPEAADQVDYRPISDVFHAPGRVVIGEPPASAAEAIVERLLDGRSNGRFGCDPIADGAIDRWRTTSDEAVLRAQLALVRAAAEDRQPVDALTRRAFMR